MKRFFPNKKRAHSRGVPKVRHATARKYRNPTQAKVAAYDIEERKNRHYDSIVKPFATDVEAMTYDECARFKVIGGKHGGLRVDALHAKDARYMSWYAEKMPHSRNGRVFRRFLNLKAQVSA